MGEKGLVKALPEGQLERFGKVVYATSTAICASAKSNSAA
jgi:hypothetical protein